jgi:hypothetical protein
VAIKGRSGSKLVSRSGKVWAHANPSIGVLTSAPSPAAHYEHVPRSTEVLDLAVLPSRACPHSEPGTLSRSGWMVNLALYRWLRPQGRGARLFPGSSEAIHWLWRQDALAAQGEPGTLSRSGWMVNLARTWHSIDGSVPRVAGGSAFPRVVRGHWLRRQDALAAQGEPGTVSCRGWMVNLALYRWLRPQGRGARLFPGSSEAIGSGGRTRWPRKVNLALCRAAAGW